MMRSVVTLAGAALVATATGCSSVVTVDGTGGSSTGGSGAGGSGTAASGAGGSGTGGGGGASGFVHGVVRLAHLLETSVAGWEQLTLSGAFYAEPWDPDVPTSGLVDSLPTPDGVVCDLYYQSGGMPPDPPPPEPPPEVDAGHLTAGTAGELLAIDFDGTHYGVDSRATGDPQHPLPGWLVPGPVDLAFVGAGSVAVPAFTAPAVLPSAATILAPPPGPTPAPLDPDGTHLVAWQPGDATEIGVRLDFNLDWDNALFLCHPPPGVTELKLPHAWLTQFTWGSGELTIEARNPTVAPPASAYVAVRPVRATRQSVYFEVW